MVTSLDWLEVKKTDASVSHGSAPIDSRLNRGPWVLFSSTFSIIPRPLSFFINREQRKWHSGHDTFGQPMPLPYKYMFCWRHIRLDRQGNSENSKTRDWDSRQKHQCSGSRNSGRNLLGDDWFSERRLRSWKLARHHISYSISQAEPHFPGNHPNEQIELYRSGPLEICAAGSPEQSRTLIFESLSTCYKRCLLFDHTDVNIVDVQQCRPVSVCIICSPVISTTQIMLLILIGNNSWIPCPLVSGTVWVRYCSLSNNAETTVPCDNAMRFVPHLPRRQCIGRWKV